MSVAHLGMVGPAVPREFAEFLDGRPAPESLPAGLGGSPVNLLTRELLRRGYRISLFTLDPAVSKPLLLRGPQLTIHVGPYRARARHRALDFFAAERRFLSDAIRAERPEILHAQWAYEFALPSQASGIPNVITAHDAPINVLQLDPSPYRLIRTMMAYRVLSRARRVVGVAPYVVEHLRRFMLYRGVDQAIPNGMPESLFARRNGPRPPDGRLVFATILVGWAGRKNGQIAVEAFAKLRLQVPQARLLMFGAGHGAGEDAQAFANEQGWAEGIDFVGAIPHARLLERLVQDVDVLLHPALEEAQPMALIEAMSLGIPVIAGEKAGGVPWTLDGGKAGRLVDVTSAAAVEAALLEFATQPELMAQFGRAGRQLAERRFHIRAVADAYEPIYGELMRGGA
jgi:glycosyltransferase involved in cell wall biosynthesis